MVTGAEAETTTLLQHIPSLSYNKIALVFGNEVDGVDQKIINQSDHIIEIPQFGTKHSLNVSVCAGVVLWEFAKKYDVIFFWDVLEHVFDLNLTISKINKILNKNGYLIINCPDHNSIMRKVLKNKWPFYLSVHLYYFNLESLMKIFSKEFEFKKQFAHFQVLSLGYVLSRAKKYFKIFFLGEKIVNTLKIYDVSVKYNMGQTTFIFKKK